MKPWIRRTLIGVFGVTALFGTLAAWGHAHGGWHHGRGGPEARAHMIDMASRRLNLDDTQKAKLNALADTLQAQRKALVADPANPRAELQALIAGPSFDRTQAQALLQAKLSTVQTQSPTVVNAFGDFFDSLRPDQQAQLREFLARGPRGGRG